MGFLSGIWLGLIFGIALMFIFVFFEERRSSQRRRLGVFIAAMSRLTMDDIRRMIPKDLFPPWVVFTGYQKVNWLNHELNRLWPYVDQATSSLLKEVLEPMLELYRPSVLDSLKFQKFTLGSIAPQFIGVETVETDDSGVKIDLELQWDGNPSIILAVKTMLGVSLPIQMKNVGFTGVFRLIFKPLVYDLPGFGAVTLSLRELKNFDFTLKVIGGEITAIPGLAGIVEGMIRTAVLDSLLWPMRQVIPIIPGDYSDLELQVTGFLEVKLVQGKELLNKDIIGKSDPFAYLYIRPIPSKMKKSKTIYNNLNPIWNEHFVFEVEDLATQKIIIKVYDEEGIQPAEFLGCAQVELKNLIPGKVTDLWLTLLKDLDKPYQTKSAKYRGQVQVELIYRSLIQNDTVPDGTLGRSSFYLTSLEKVMSTNFNGIRKSTSSKLLSPVKIREGSIIRGILSVTVIRAENLTAMDFNDSSDPYVVIKMKKSDTQKRTRVIPKTLNPEWNQTFSIMVEDALHDLLIVELWDHNTFLQKPMGKCALTLTKLLHEGEYDTEVEMSTGKLLLHLKWTEPVAPDPQCF